MKLLLTIIILTTLLSCSSKKGKIIDKQKTETANRSSKGSVKNDSVNTPVILPIITKYNPKEREQYLDSIETDSKQNIERAIKKHEGIPSDGTYIYDISYSEWQGRSMGEKVKVIIIGNTIKIISEGNPSMTAKKGEILDEGTLIKHNVTGDWLISSNPSDADLEAYGGCVGAPMVIDFVNKVYITC